MIGEKGRVCHSGSSQSLLPSALTVCSKTSRLKFRIISHACLYTDYHPCAECPEWQGYHSHQLLFTPQDLYVTPLTPLLPRGELRSLRGVSTVPNLHVIPVRCSEQFVFALLQGSPFIHLCICGTALQQWTPSVDRSTMKISLQFQQSVRAHSRAASENHCN